MGDKLGVMSLPTSSHAYGIGLVAVIIGAAIGIGYYQFYYYPEFNARPHIGKRILHPGQTTVIHIAEGAATQGNGQYFVPAKQVVQLGVDNRVTWINNDCTGCVHFVDLDTSKSHYLDRFSGPLASPPIKSKGSNTFLFPQPGKVFYYCKVHPWMKGEIDVVQGAATS